MANERRVASLSRQESYDSLADKQAESGCWEEILKMAGRLLLATSRLLFSRPRRGTPKSRRSQSSLDDPRETTSLKVFCCCCFQLVADTRAFKVLFSARDRVRAAVDSKLFQVIISIFNQR
jgi:hypothetical protein